MNILNYFYRDSAGREIGPLPLSDLAQLRKAGVLTDATPVRGEKDTVWTVCSNVIAAGPAVATHAGVPAQATHVSTPVVSRPPLSKKAKIGRAIGTIIAVAALVAVGYVIQSHRAPSTSAVRKYVAQINDSSRIEVTTVSTQIIPTTKDHATVTYNAVIRLRQPLFTRLDEKEYMAKNLGFTPNVSSEIYALLNNRGTSRILEIANLKKASDPLSSIVLLRQETAEGSEANLEGRLEASRFDDGWHFEPAGVQTWSGPTWKGDLKGSFVGEALLADDPASSVRLKAIMREQSDLAATLEAANKIRLVEKKARQANVLAALIDSIQRGSLFKGVAVGANKEAVPLYLEITSVDSSTKQVEAVLRNDGGWDDSRGFNGNFNFNQEDESLNVILETRFTDAVRDGGPFLQNPEQWQLSFRLIDGHMEATSPSGNWHYIFDRLNAEDSARQMQVLKSGVQALVDSTRPGTTYHGFATSKGDGTRYEYLLQFESQNGEGMTASLAPTIRADLKRPFRVFTIGNRYRANGWPLVLETQYGKNIKGSNMNSPATVAVGFKVNMKLSDERLIGESNDFTYEFERATPDFLASRAAAHLKHEKTVLGFLRAGASYSGTFHSADGMYAENVRLSFNRVDERGSIVDASMYSSDLPGIYAHLRGKADIEGGRITLSRVNSMLDNRGVLHCPFFVERYGNYSLDLDVLEGNASGSIRNQPWKVEFAFNIDDVAPSADFPNTPGAYAWIGNQWTSLPRNNGHRVDNIGEQFAGALLGALANRVNGNQTSQSGRSEIVGDLVFDGADNVPTADGSNLRIVFIGPLSSVDGNAVARYPQLRDYPAVEMAQTQRSQNGIRETGLYSIAPGFDGFSGNRVSAVVERLDPSTTLFTCAQPIPAGNYALLVKTEAFEINLR